MKLRNSVPLIIGRLAYVAGIADILANVLTPVKSSTQKINRYLPIFIHSAAFATSVVTGVVLIILARNLIRRKRRAWALSSANCRRRFLIIATNCLPQRVLCSFGSDDKATPTL